MSGPAGDVPEGAGPVVPEPESEPVVPEPDAATDGQRRFSASLGAGLAIGAGVGAALMAATDSSAWLAAGIGVGLALGAGIGSSYLRKD